MTTDTAAVVAALRRLAKAEEACPHKHLVSAGFVTPFPHLSFCPGRCSGTGRVPLFCDADGEALLRKECTGGGGIACPVSGAPLGNPMPNISGEPERCICRGLGWLPLDVSEVHLEMLLLLAINNESASLAGGQLFHTMMSALEAKARDAKTGQDLIEAAILALDKMLP